VRFAERAQVRSIGMVMRRAFVARRRVRLAAAHESLGRKSVIIGRVLSEGDRHSVHASQNAVRFDSAGVVFGDEIMRQVDHEARIASDRTFGDAPGIQQDDVIFRVKLSQLPRSRQPGETGSDDQPICPACALQFRIAPACRQNGIPRRRAGIFRQSRNLHGKLSFAVRPPSTV